LGFTRELRLERWAQRGDKAGEFRLMVERESEDDILTDDDEE
jgi:hypothetical protein